VLYLLDLSREEIEQAEAELGLAGR